MTESHTSTNVSSEMSVEAQLHQARTERADGHLFQAIATLTRILSVHSDHAEALCLRAGILLAMGQTTEALADADNLVRLNPSSAPARCLQARILQVSGHIAEAIEAAQEAHRLDTDNVEAALLLATLCEQGHRRKEALSLYDDTIARHPSNAEAYLLRGRLKMQLRDQVGATEDFQRALKLDPAALKRLDGCFSNGKPPISF